VASFVEIHHTDLIANSSRPTLSKQRFFRNFDDGHWSIDRRITSIITDGSSEEKDLLPRLLAQTGWDILTVPKKIKIDHSCLFVPSWNAGRVTLQTFHNFIEDHDYFVDIARVMFYIKVRRT